MKLTNSITTARKTISKLVKLQSLATKCCKMRKIKPCKICQVVSFCITSWNLRHFWRIQNWQISQGCTFRIPQHFATKPCNSTISELHLSTVVIYFAFHVQIKTLPNHGIAYYRRQFCAYSAQSGNMRKIQHSTFLHVIVQMRVRGFLPISKHREELKLRGEAKRF